MSEAPRPQISVIVFAREAAASIRETLKSLVEQDGFEESEVIVADCSDDGTSAIVEREFPGVRRLALDPLTMPEGKAQAIRAARGEIIAILDAHDRAGPGWLREIARGLSETDFEAIGGEVLFDGPATAGNCAGYLFEYGAFAPPLQDGVTEGDLPGNNVAYRRRVFDETCGELLERGFWKPFFHKRIREAGGCLGLYPSMRVHHHIRTGLFAFCRRRFHYGRCFGAMRLEAARGRRAFVLAVFAPAAIPILCFRHVRRAMGHDGNRKLLSSKVSALLLLCCAWGLGEWIGAWFGPGRSCQMVY